MDIGMGTGIDIGTCRGEGVGTGTGMDIGTVRGTETDVDCALSANNC